MSRGVQLHSLDEAVVSRERDVEGGARRDEVVGRLGFPEHPAHVAQHREELVVSSPGLRLVEIAEGRGEPDAEQGEERGEHVALGGPQRAAQ